MTTSAKVRVAPDDGDDSVYGPVEIAWYPDHLEVTALGAGRASVSDACCGEDVTIEIRPPSLDELVETVPGAD